MIHKQRAERFVSGCVQRINGWPAADYRVYIALGVRYGKTTNHIAYVIENMKSGEKTPVAELIPTDTSVNRSLIYGVMRVLILWRFPAEANVVFCFVSDYKAREFLSPVVSALVGSDTPLARSCPEYLDEIHSIVENKHLSLWYRDLCTGDDAEVLKAMEDCSALASSEDEILLGCDAVEENVLEFIRAYTMIIDVPDVFKRIIPVKNVGAFARDHGVKPETAIALLFFQKKERPAAESYLDLKPNGQDRYSRLKKDVLFALLTEEEEADFDETIGDYISDPTEALTCLRWYLRGLSLDDAIRKVLLDRANKQCGMFGCISYIRDLGERGKKYHWLFPSVWPDAKAPDSAEAR